VRSVGWRAPQRATFLRIHRPFFPSYPCLTTLYISHPFPNPFVSTGCARVKVQRERERAREGERGKREKEGQRQGERAGWRDRKSGGDDGGGVWGKGKMRKRAAKCHDKKVLCSLFPPNLSRVCDGEVPPASLRRSYALARAHVCGSGLLFILAGACVFHCVDHSAP
jgi:hypothetical protein